MKQKFVVNCFFRECFGPHTVFEFDTMEEALECEMQEDRSTNNWDSVQLDVVDVECGD
jgi:hypothetical protein